MTQDDPSLKPRPPSRVRTTANTTSNSRTNPPSSSSTRATRLTIGSSTNPKPARPSSRVLLSPTSPSMTPRSPIKTTSATPAKIPQRTSGRPLWNSGKANCGLSLNLTKPTPTRASTRTALPRSRGEDQASEMSFANTTFVSAASGFDENRRPISPSKSPLKGSHPSILAGLGFGRIAGSKTPTHEAKGVTSPTKVGSSERTIAGYDPQKEPIKAFLRIRPPHASSTAKSPYIEILNDTEVLLTPPTQSSATNLSSHDSSAKYKFTRVYGPQASQEEFFQGTTLPLVGDLLEGKSSLCFAYGVTASGKTYTVQGGLDTSRDGASMDPGLLPRTMDVLFNSIGDQQTEMRVRPARLTAVEIAPLIPDQPTLIQRCSLSNAQLETATQSILKDETVLPIDLNSEYGIWISYAEVYNEKVYDLLDSHSSLLTSSSSGTTFQSLTANITEQVKNVTQMLHNKASSSGGVIKRKALILKHDKPNGNKYIHGLTEIRVKSTEEAKLLLRHGQINRSVFSTLANRTSSRSHGIFTIKVLRISKHINGNDNLLSHSQVSRLSIVDLAGSERTRNTQTTGERLKEAGNINKSLMVLGQCMETLRKNQDFVHHSRKQSIVPFRHSKLTELFQSFFTGEGKTVMIVNVNPFDTGFEENSHVMKFSAVASEVSTIKEGRNFLHPELLKPINRQVVADEVIKECSLVIEDEDEDTGEIETEDSDGDDGFVNHLLDQLSIMKVKLVEAEIRAAMIEAEVREEVMQEYKERMMEMEEMFLKNMALEAQEAELKTDRKIDIFNRATQHQNDEENEDDEEDDEEESFDEKLEDVDHGEEEEGPESPTPQRGTENKEETNDEPRRKLRSRVI